MADQRVVRKNLAGQEDLLFGEGQVAQTRAGGAYNITKNRVIYPVNSIEELNVLDPEKFPKAQLYDGNLVTSYLYNPSTELYEQTNVLLDDAQVIADLSLPYAFDTVAAYKTFPTAFPVGKVVKLLDRGVEFTVISGTGTADEYGIIANNTTSQSAQIIDDGSATAINYGAVGDGVTDDSSPMLAFVAAKPKGTTRFIGASSYNCPTGNFDGVVFKANSTGKITSNTTAVVINESNNNSYYPSVDVEESPAFIVENTPNLLLVCTPSKSDAGYLLYSLVDNITTTNNSLAVTASDATSWRINRVQHAVFACVGLNNFDSSTGTWTATNMNQVDPSMPAFDSSRRYSYWQNKSNTNESLTYNSVPVVNGVLSMTFASTSGSNPTCDITIDGTLHTVDLTQASGEFLRVNFAIPSKKSVSVLIENTTGGAFKFCNFLGFYFNELKDYNGEPLDEYGYYRDTATWSEYSSDSSNSENNYTIKEFNSDTYGGGYHGGETVITNTFKDGVTTITPSSTVQASKRLSLKTSCTVDWTPVGDSTVVELTKRINFCDSGYTEEIVVDGDITAIEEFSFLFGFNNDFSLIEAPIVGDVTNLVADTGRLLVGKSNRVVLKSSTGQLVDIDMTQHRYDNGNRYGGINIWRVDGTYNKVYYNKTHSVKDELPNGIYSSKRITFR